MKNLFSNLPLAIFTLLGINTKSCDVAPTDGLDDSQFVSACKEELEKPSVSDTSSELLYAC